jgi:hypothetical protein
MKNASDNLYTEFDAGTQADLAPDADNSAHGSSASQAPAFERMVMLGSTGRQVGAKSYHRVAGVIQAEYKPPTTYNQYLEMPVTGFDDMSAKVLRMLEMPNHHLIFGRLREDGDPKSISRRSINSVRNGKPGDIMPALQSVIVLDTESVRLDLVEDLRVDPEDAANLLYRILTDALPELEDVRCLVVYSSSAGFDAVHDRDGSRKVIDTVRAHMFLLSARPMTDAQIKVLVHKINDEAQRLHGDKLKTSAEGVVSKFLDDGIYGTAKLVGTSRPVLYGGVTDPLPGKMRWVEIEGLHDTFDVEIAHDAVDESEGDHNYTPLPRPAPGLYAPDSEAKIRSAAKALAGSNGSKSNVIRDWDQWKLKVMFGLIRACSHLGNGLDLARELAHEISAANAKYSYAVTEDQFRQLLQMPLDDVTERSFFGWARQTGWSWRDEVADRKFIYMPPDKTPPLAGELKAIENVRAAVGDDEFEVVSLAVANIPIRRAHEAWDEVTRLRHRQWEVDNDFPPQRGDDTLADRLAVAERRFDRLHEASGIEHDPRKPGETLKWIGSRWVNEVVLSTAAMGSTKTTSLAELLRTGTLPHLLAGIPGYSHRSPQG